MKNYDFIVTGGLGFIGSHMVELLNKKGQTVLVIDKKTYAANDDFLEYCKNDKYIDLLLEDINNINFIPNCRAIFNFAAESHVDNSIESSYLTAKSNFMGVNNLLERIIKKDEGSRPLFFQISTDEVYGDIKNGSFKESDKLNPSNPYSATKAAAEHLITSYGRTYGLKYLITRSSNNFGLRQYPEKLIPRALFCIEHNQEFPIHGDGTYIRNWLHVKDHVSAIWKLFKLYNNNNLKNEIYNISGSVSLKNIEILDMLEKVTNKKIIKNFISNRPGQDKRYAISCDKLKNCTDWVENNSLSLRTLTEIWKDEKF